VTSLVEPESGALVTSLVEPESGALVTSLVEPESGALVVCLVVRMPMCVLYQVIPAKLVPGAFSLTHPDKDQQLARSQFVFMFTQTAKL
jgi:hypothetical protein